MTAAETPPTELADEPRAGFPFEPPAASPDQRPVPPQDPDLWAARALGAALALAAFDPMHLVHADSALAAVLELLLLAGLLTLSWFASRPVVARPVSKDALWRSKLSRHRNTALAVGFVLVAAVRTPPVWLMACDAGALLAYLLFVDATAGGPPGAAQLRSWPAVAGALVAQGLVLTGAVMSVATAHSWARALAAILLLAVGAAVSLALWRRPRRGGPSGRG
jgi:hypothetical protein